MLDPRTEERRKAAVVGLSGQMKLQEGVKEALQKVAQRSDDGWAVVLVSRPPIARIESSYACPQAKVQGCYVLSGASFTRPDMLLTLAAG